MNQRISLTLGLGGLVALAALVVPQLIPQVEAEQPAVATVAALDVPTPAAAAPSDPVEQPAPEAEGPLVELVICLDNSGSMSNLLDSARARLWDIVNEVSAAKPTPHVKVALVTFGSPRDASADKGFVKVRSDLTDDLDSLYGELMEVTTNGGDEYVGWALHTALEELSWSSEPDTLRILFVAGNEGADQGVSSHDYRTVTAQARERGMVVNSIFGGPYASGVHAGWQDLARAGGGVYTAISMERGVANRAAPQDAELQRLNQSLNATYIPYGARGEEGKRKQVQQDRAAYGMGSSSGSSRSGTKGSSNYRNEHWDLVDAVDRKGVAVGELTAAQLPAAMRSMSSEEREAYVAQKKAERAQLKAQIASTNAERLQHLRDAAEESDEEGLDEAMIEALQGQLEAGGLDVE